MSSMRPYESYFQEPGNRRFKSYQSNETLKAIYEFMGSEKSLDAMIRVSDLKRPALEAVIESIERDFAFNDAFNIMLNHRHRQILGSFCRFILAPEGYKPVRSVKMKKGRYINSGTVYNKSFS